ncbi:MAG TPA: VC0807 family protein [Gaiellaceae bacterium]|jgi:intracellular septation protein A|nr:VC0807 family protein [Gaiellaceae bacterium]
MVRPPGAPLAERLNELPEPTWQLLLRRGLPQFAVEGFVPVLVFYGLWRSAGLGVAVIASTVLSLAIAAWQVRHGRQGGLAVVSALFVVVQALVALAAHSATVYLAQPVVLSAIWGLVYLGSVVVDRPLVGVFASAWYPFPVWFQASAPYRREFALQSLVWAAYCLGRAGLRLYVLLHTGVGGFVVISVVTGAPVLAALVFWGLWHARRTFGRLDVAAFAA